MALLVSFLDNFRNTWIWIVAMFSYIGSNHSTPSRNPKELCVVFQFVFSSCCLLIQSVESHLEYLRQGSPTWCPRAPSRPQGPSRSPTDLF